MKRRTRKRSPNLGRQRSAPAGVPPAETASTAARNRQPAMEAQREALKAATVKHGTYWLQRFGLTVLLIAALASAVNILSLSATAKVERLAGQTALPRQAEYQAAANKLLAASVWNRNKITVDTGSVRQELLKQFPELADVSVTVPVLAHRPIVYVELAKAVIILQNNTGAYVIDNTGRTLAKAANAAALNQPGLPIVADQSGLALELNQQALSTDNIDFIQQILAQLAAKKLSVTGMSLPASASELDVQLAGQPYIVKFNLQSNDARRQAGTLLGTLNELHRQNITPGKYIDVRLSGRGYYQ